MYNWKGVQELSQISSNLPVAVNVVKSQCPLNSYCLTSFLYMYNWEAIAAEVYAAQVYIYFTLEGR